MVFGSSAVCYPAVYQLFHCSGQWITVSADISPLESYFEFFTIFYLTLAYCQLRADLNIFNSKKSFPCQYPIKFRLKAQHTNCDILTTEHKRAYRESSAPPCYDVEKPLAASLNKGINRIFLRGLNQRKNKIFYIVEIV